MSLTLLLLLLLLLLLQAVATVTAWKYVHVQIYMTWTEAQTLCRTNYTDLAPISTRYDSERLYLEQLSSWRYRSIWIGLMKNPTDRTKWTWSGGTQVSQSFWAPGWPSGYAKWKVVIYGNEWYDQPAARMFTVLCYKVHAVRESLTWEDALEYCSRHHSDLASVASETEMMLMEKELSKGLSSDSVWIGLRFLAGQWLWADGQPFRYESWEAPQTPLCPDVRRSCVAIQVSGTTATAGLLSVEGVEGWTMHDCNEKRHFLCY